MPDNGRLLRAYPITWIHVKYGLRYDNILSKGGYRSGWIPDTFDLRHNGVEPLFDEVFSVILKPSIQIISNLQEWIYDNTKNNYKMLGLFSLNYVENPNDLKPSNTLCEGVSFQFEESEHACMFKMTFA